MVPLHPAVHTQVLGAVQVPPFGQNVAPEHSAEMEMSIIKPQAHMSAAKYILTMTG